MVQRVSYRGNKSGTVSFVQSNKNGTAKFRTKVIRVVSPHDIASFVRGLKKVIPPRVT